LAPRLPPVFPAVRAQPFHLSLSSEFNVMSPPPAPHRFGRAAAALRRRLRRSMLALTSRLPDRAQGALFHPRIRAVAGHVPVLRNVYLGCLRTHPFDLHYGTDTSGLVHPDDYGAHASDANCLKPYIGLQPSIIRQALVTLGQTRDYAFVDFGCGKGRPMIVASEFPFRTIVGFDINHDLVEIANRNAARVARRHPQRAPLHALRADVREAMLPAGKLVIFLYNPFSGPLMAALFDRIEAGLRSDIEHPFIVAYNPVSGALFDRSAALTRWFAQDFPYDAAEVGYGPETREVVVVWQSVRGARPCNFPGRRQAIEVSGETARLRDLPAAPRED
jgi:SAM-dependent methyltransferase